MVTFSLMTDPPVDEWYGVARILGLLGFSGTSLALAVLPEASVPQCMAGPQRRRQVMGFAMGMMLLLAHGVAAAIAYRSWRVFLPRAGSLQGVLERGGSVALALLLLGGVFCLLPGETRMQTSHRLWCGGYLVAVLHACAVGANQDLKSVTLAVLACGIMFLCLSRERRRWKEDR